MQPIAVVKHGYILQHILLRFETCLVVAPLNSLLFQAPEEAFRNRVILTVSFAAHATYKPMVFQ